jgi:hypothetical protein
VIDVLVFGSLAILAVVAIRLAGARARAHAERPKHELLERIAQFEAVHPRREVLDPHRKPRSLGSTRA